MKTRARNRYALLTVGVVLIGLSLACVLWVRKEQRQYMLNRQLIGVLMRGDSKQAIALLETGADPNTRYAPLPAPTLPRLVNRLLHKAALPLTKSPTAFMMACGASWTDEHQRYIRIPSGDRHLTEVMLQHGADVDAQDTEGKTALHWAVINLNRDLIKQLLTHNANPYKTTKDGDTTIAIAERSTTTR